MTSRADRLPSERTPERELVDKLDEMLLALRDAERRPGGSWWDQLPAAAANLFAAPAWNEFALRSVHPAMDVRLRCQQMANCIDLMLLDGSGTVWWQRRLFFGPPGQP